MMNAIVDCLVESRRGEHVHVEAGTPARNCASRSSPGSHVPTTGAADKPLSAVDPHRIRSNHDRTGSAGRVTETVTYLPAADPIAVTTSRLERPEISHAADDSARHPCRVTGRPGRTQLSLHCLRGPCSVVGVASHPPAASPTCSRLTTTWFSIQLQRVNVHRDGVFGVDVTGVAIVLLERPREVGDLHHQPRAPGGGRRCHVDMEVDVVEASRALHTDVIRYSEQSVTSSGRCIWL